MLNFTYVQAEVNIDAHFEQQFKDILGIEINPLCKNELIRFGENVRNWLAVNTSKIYQDGKYAHFFINGTLEDYDDDVIEWFIGRISMLKNLAKEEKYGYDPVLRAVICVDRGIFPKPFNRLHVWQLDQTYSEEWLHD